MGKNKFQCSILIFFLLTWRIRYFSFCLECLGGTRFTEAGRKKQDISTLYTDRIYFAGVRYLDRISLLMLQNL